MVFGKPCVAKVTFNITTDHKIDSKAAGRYLSCKMTLGTTKYKDFELIGFDIEITQTGFQWAQYGHVLQSA